MEISSYLAVILLFLPTIDWLERTRAQAGVIEKAGRNGVISLSLLCKKKKKKPPSPPPPDIITLCVSPILK